MAYVAIGRIRKAIESLKRFHAFYGVSFLSMKSSGMTPGKPMTWGGQQENALLQTYYAPPGGRPDKPFFVPLGRPDADTGFWKNPKYSGGVLQRARTTDNFADALTHPSPTTWSFAANYVDVLTKLLPKDGRTVIRIPVLDLAAWIFRDKALPRDLKHVEVLFRDTFKLADNNEYTNLFEFIPEEEGQFFFDDPINTDDFIQLIGGVPSGPTLRDRTEEDLLVHLESWMTQKELMELPVGFVRNAYQSLKSQRFIVLAGRPGTGKTAFARAMARALEDFFPGAVSEVVISVGPDFTEADVIGYEKIAGDLAATELSKALFLSGRPNDLYIVILDEMNLSQVDHYLARLLPAIESDAPVELPGGVGRKFLPIDTFIIGNINSYLEETSRLPLSGPVKRRANVIEMPNPLDAILKGDDQLRLAHVSIDLLRQTKARITNRQKDGAISVLDGFRVAALDKALADGSAVRVPEFNSALWNICKTCAADVTTSLTLGILQDLLEFVALSNTSPMRSLDHQIAQKIAPQLVGPAAVVRQLLTVVTAMVDANCDFSHARVALEQLLKHEDRGTGLIVSRY